ncbi:MAG: glycosyl hydrolase family protein [Clostridiales bacterium]|nr:glycosyl hydrolase family protein [Clostridiales bacterium]
MIINTFKRRYLRLLTVFALAFIFIFSSCSLFEPATLELSEEQVMLTVGESASVLAVSNKKNLKWTSSDEDIATVSSNGEITAISAGEVDITVSVAGVSATCTVVVEDGFIKNLALIWQDEFIGDELDLTKWGYQTGIRDFYNGRASGSKHWGNNELQYYTEDSVTVQDGVLTITAQKREMEEMEYTSARILTRDLAYFTYGYFEARIKLPAVNGMWPAFWMLPQPNGENGTANDYGTWAASGEIDIMEAKGRVDNEIGNALHFGGNWPNNTYLADNERLNSSISEWHTYGIDWRSDKITWYVDGVQSFTLESERWWTASSNEDSAPFDRDFYLLLNLAVGGNYDNGVTPPDDFISADMQVDYVRVFKHLES